MLVGPLRWIVSFLHFGYLPQVPEDVTLEFWAGSVAPLHSVREALDESQLIAQGIRSHKAAFDDLIEDTKVGDTHIVPLSGGLDSRAILGGLLDAGLKNQIVTVTFGTPGTFDYDIGCDVARQMGMRYERFDLTQIKLEQEILEETARDIGTWVWLFDAFYNRLIAKRFGEGVTYWSGFKGEALSGAHLPGRESHSWEEAKAHFVNLNRFARSITLVPSGFRPEDVLAKSSLLDRGCLSYDDQLDFAIRQQCYIKPVVLPKGYDYRTPFLQPDWVDFILTVPRRYRENQYLYKEILRKAYPKLFSLPTKNNRGLPLDAPKWRLPLQWMSVGIRYRIACRFFPYRSWCIHPAVNYIDFDWALRNREDLKTLVYENIQALKQRRIVDWIDIDVIWSRHQSGKANHADALTLLTSLEINLKVKGEEIAL